MEGTKKRISLGVLRDAYKGKKVNVGETNT